MSNKEIMEQINSDWCDLEKSMGEMAALEVACQQNGKSSEWFYDNIELISSPDRVDQ